MLRGQKHGRRGEAAACMSVASLAAFLPLTWSLARFQSHRPAPVPTSRQKIYTTDRATTQNTHRVPYLFSGSSPLSFSAPCPLRAFRPGCRTHLAVSSSRPPRRPPHPLCSSPLPDASPESQGRMPAQKRQRPSPSSKPRDHVEANGTDASTAGGALGEGGGIQPVPGGGAANRATDPQPRRVGGELSPHRHLSYLAIASCSACFGVNIG
jgi:hypothetical protein